MEGQFQYTIKVMSVQINRQNKNLFIGAVSYFAPFSFIEMILALANEKGINHNILVWLNNNSPFCDKTYCQIIFSIETN